MKDISVDKLIASQSQTAYFRDGPLEGTYRVFDRGVPDVVKAYRMPSISMLEEADTTYIEPELVEYVFAYNTSDCKVYTLKEDIE